MKKPPFPPIPLTHVCHDSRLAGPGTLFVAVRGRHTDGHRYLREAFHRGARAFVVETGRLGSVPHDLRPYVVAAVPDTRMALPYLATDFHRHPARNLFVVGITGTNGKTTVASLVRHIRNGAGVPPPRGRWGLVGTLGIDTGRRQSPSPLTTPEAPRLQEAFAEMRAAGLGGAVIEVSSQAISHRRVDGIPFALVALTQITPDHQDVHSSFQVYRDLKLNFLRRQPPRTLVAVNGDDPAGAAFVRTDPFPERTYTYGRRPGADLQVTRVRATRAGLRLDLRPSPRLLAFMARAAKGHSRPGLRGPAPFVPSPPSGPEAAPWRLVSPLLGLHNGYNVAAAALICALAGTDWTAIVRGIGSFQAPERRLQLHRLRGRHVLDDTAMNPASYDSALATARSLRLPGTGGRFILVSAVRGQRGPLVNEQNAGVIAAWAARLPLARVYVTDSEEAVGPGDRVDEGERRAVLRVLTEARIRWEHHRKLEPALEAAWAESRPGDVILLLGAQGMDAGWPLLQERVRNGRPAPRESPPTPPGGAI